jgi:hypothetical protein
MYELLHTSLVAQQKKQRRYAAVTGRSDVRSLRPPEGMRKGISGSSLNLPGPGKSPLGGPVTSNVGDRNEVEEQGQGQSR